MGEKPCALRREAPFLSHIGASPRRAGREWATAWAWRGCGCGVGQRASGCAARRPNRHARRPRRNPNRTEPKEESKSISRISSGFWNAESEDRSNGAAAGGDRVAFALSQSARCHSRLRIPCLAWPVSRLHTKDRHHTRARARPSALRAPPTRPLSAVPHMHGPAHTPVSLNTTAVSLGMCEPLRRRRQPSPARASCAPLIDRGE